MTQTTQKFRGPLTPMVAMAANGRAYRVELFDPARRAMRKVEVWSPDKAVAQTTAKLVRTGERAVIQAVRT